MYRNSQRLWDAIPTLHVGVLSVISHQGDGQILLYTFRMWSTPPSQIACFILGHCCRSLNQPEHVCVQASMYTCMSETCTYSHLAVPGSKERNYCIDSEGRARLYIPQKEISLQEPLSAVPQPSQILCQLSGESWLPTWVKIHTVD